MKKKTLLTVVLILLILLPTFAFGGKEVKKNTKITNKKAETVSVEQKTAKTENNSATVANTVNTVSSASDTSTSISTPMYKIDIPSSSEPIYITHEDVHEAIDYLSEAYGTTISEEDAAEYLIEQILFNQALVRAITNNEIDLYDGTFNEYVSYQLSLYASYYGINLTTTEEAEAFLAQFNMSYEDFANQVLQDYAQEAMIQMYSNGRLESITEPTTEEITAYYNSNKAQFVSDESVLLAHIYFAYGSDKEVAKVRANTALNNIKNGLPFDDAVATYSEDSATKDNNGEFGVWIGKHDEGAISSFGENAMNAIFSLKVNEVSSVVEGSQGCHIFKVLDYKESNLLGLDDLYDFNYDYTVSEVIAQNLYSQKEATVYAEIYNDIILKLKNEATIKSLN